MFCSRSSTVADERRAIYLTRSAPLKAERQGIDRRAAPHAIVESTVGVWFLRGLSVR